MLSYILVPYRPPQPLRSALQGESGEAPIPKMLLKPDIENVMLRGTLLCSITLTWYSAGLHTKGIIPQLKQRKPGSSLTQA